MHSLNILALSLVAALLLGACGGRGDKDRQEDVTALRTLGVALNPLITTPSPNGGNLSTVQATLYAAVPLTDDATLVPYADDGSSEGALPMPTSAITIVPNSSIYQTHNNFKIFSAQATINIPTLAQLQALQGGGAFKGGQLRYGLTITTATAHENIIANIVVLPSGAAETTWTNPTIAISNPIDLGTVSTATDNDLSATVSNPNNETLKIGWFVSAGQISNRNAATTMWTLSDAGPATVAVVVHGKNSRGFALKVIDVVGK